MNEWFTSDLHFFHKRVVEFCGRPWTTEEQTEALIERWNSQVGLMDPVYHLGDFAFAGPEKARNVAQIIRRLHGCIRFIRGNHCDSRLWRMLEDENIPHVVWVKDYRKEKLHGQKIILAHYPFACWDGMHHGSWHLHGHLHQHKSGVQGKIMNVCLDSHPDFRLYSFDEVKEYMDKQPTADTHHGDL